MGSKDPAGVGLCVTSLSFKSNVIYQFYTSNMTLKGFALALIVSSCLFINTVAYSQGSIIKGQTSTAIYYYAVDGKRYVFPNDKTYLSWYPDFSNITVVSDTDLASIPIGGNVTYRPGKRLVKIQTD